jgi:O-antigen/teichoic acid export membrane protein
MAPELWLELFFGAEFAAYGAVLQWFALVYLAIALNLPLRAGLRAIENTKFIFFAQGLSFIISVSLSTWLVSTFGILGVPYGFLTINVVTLVILGGGFRTALATPRHTA